MTSGVGRWPSWLGPALRATLLVLVVGVAWFPGRVEDATGLEVPTAQLAVGFFALYVVCTFWPVPQLRARRGRAVGVAPEQQPATREPETVEKALQRVAARRAASAADSKQDTSR